jgi:transcriptional regulator with XRE-family HTH domain
MDRPGEKLKRIREKLKLTYRDVEKASQQIATRHGNDEFAIALSRLADIEHKGTVPTIFRIYSLCAIYRLEVDEVMSWYGVPAGSIASDFFHTPLEHTHVVQAEEFPTVTVPYPSEAVFDPARTTFLSHVVRRWGKTGLGLLNGFDVRRYRYGFIGLEDWSMYPLLRPGSLVLIDDGRRRIARHGWTSELDRPIYFLELRQGYRCGWCSTSGGKFILQPHPASQQPPEVFDAGEIDVVGQVTGVAMILDSRARPHSRSSVTAAGSPNL